MKIIEFLELGDSKSRNSVEFLKARVLINECVYVVSITTKTLDLDIEPMNLSNREIEELSKLMQDALIKRGTILARAAKFKQKFKEI